MSEPARPLSPHLQVYRLPFTAVLSILHRITGVVLSLGLILLVGILATAALDAASYEWLRARLLAWWGQLFLFAWTVALYLHLCNGVRHLFWDAGFGFALKTSNITAWLTVFATLVLTAATWLLALWSRGVL